MRIEIEEYSLSGYHVFLNDGETYHHIDRVIKKLNLPINREELTKLVISMNGEIDIFSDIYFSNYDEAEKFKEFLEPYLIMEELTK